jgi:2-haloacid dehalogenase
VLSNGTPDMLEAALGSAGLRDALDAVFSIEEVGTYKPSPAVYELPASAFGLVPRALGFVSANAWDAAGAASAGMQVIHVNRTGAPAERLPHGPATEVRSLGEIATLIGLARPRVS